MFALKIKPVADKKIQKLRSKDHVRYEILMKKIDEILFDTKNYKNLRGGMFGLKRVHIDKSFVLTFQIFENEQIVEIVDFDHHDNIYK